MSDDRVCYCESYYNFVCWPCKQRGAAEKLQRIYDGISEALDCEKNGHSYKCEDCGTADPARIRTALTLLRLVEEERMWVCRLDGTAVHPREVPAYIEAIEAAEKERE